MGSLKVSGGIDGAWVGIFGELNSSFDEMVKTMPDTCKKALNVGAWILKNSVKSCFARKMPAAARAFKVPATSKGGYKITKPDMLIDAVMQSSATTDHATISVRGNAPGSPLFISRMYDSGTKDRYLRTYKGKKLNKRHYVGSVGGVHYFGPGINEGEEAAYAAMQNIFEKQLSKIYG